MSHPKTAYLLLLHDPFSGETRLETYSEDTPTLPIKWIYGTVATEAAEDYGKACDKLTTHIKTYHPGVNKFLENQDQANDVRDLPPPITHLLRFFRYEHLPPELQVVSRPFSELAHRMAKELPINPELTVALRKLLEAKDCTVRSMV